MGGRFQSVRSLGQTNSTNNNLLTRSQNQSQLSRYQFGQKQAWKEHYGEHQRQPFFNDLDIDERLYDLTPMQKKKFISQKLFYPPGQSGIKSVFSSYDYYYQNDVDPKNYQPIVYNDKNFII
ncbi:hypothetical protein PPERSA_02809 [Pseudocohnilembus persalinus]|uniref:Uncharacterized protein n=1 Tax=Pseudocohnilembus persalinus TaxID=266149 RepID=A0A0V0QMH6_PSEPJ|nr:hypothetical protein PPERSA_02809 [Pseudocohnilembus persalinus]|eukprot:KRX03430.1 hypothetical protein PPERSA_02809 [Pseudocohnilembus persalinus]